MLFVTVFSVFSVREIVTQKNQLFHFELSRIALIITIRIATIKNRFSLFLSLFRQFSTPQLLPISQESQSSPRLAAASPITGPVGRESLEERWITAISTSIIRCFNSYRLVSLFFRYALLIDVEPPLKFRRYFFHLFGSYSLIFIEHS